MTSAELAGLEERVTQHLARGAHREAVTEAIRGLGPQILSYLIAMFRDEETGYEVFSRFSLALWEGIERFRGESSVKTWAYQIAFHCARDYQRDPYRRRGRPLKTSEASQLAMEVRTSTATFLRTEARDALAKLRETLPLEDQTLLILRTRRKMPWSEIARVLAGETGAPATEAGLRKRFERLKEKLRSLAKEAGMLEGRD